MTSAGYWIQILGHQYCEEDEDPNAEKNCVLSQAGWRLIGLRAMLRFTPLPLRERSRMRAVRALFSREGGSIRNNCPVGVMRMVRVIPSCKLGRSLGKPEVILRCS